MINTISTVASSDVMSLATLLGFITSAVAAVFAYFAWRRPVPNLEVDKSVKASCENIPGGMNGNYLIRLKLPITNISGIPAKIIAIEGIPSHPSETVQTGNGPITASGIQDTISDFGKSLIVGSTLNSGQSSNLVVAVLDKERPNKLRIVIRTANRSFKVNVPVNGL